MQKLFATFDDLAASGYLFRITDDGSETADRYTVLFSDGDALGMAEAGIGFSEFVGRVDPNFMQNMVDAGSWRDVGPADLSEASREHILGRINQAFADAVAGLETSVPETREGIDLNDGTHTCAGKGIWKGPEGFMIAIEEDEDTGPYASALEAFRASLPDSYALSGPEHHSPLFPLQPEGMREEEPAM